MADEAATNGTQAHESRLDDELEAHTQIEAASADAEDPFEARLATATAPEKTVSSLSHQGHNRYESFSRSKYSSTSTFDEIASSEAVEESTSIWDVEAENPFEVEKTVLEPLGEIATEDESSQILTQEQSAAADQGEEPVEIVADGDSNRQADQEHFADDAPHEVMQQLKEPEQPHFTSRDVSYAEVAATATANPDQEGPLLTAEHESDPFGEVTDEWMEEAKQPTSVTAEPDAAPSTEPSPNPFKNDGDEDWLQQETTFPSQSQRQGPNLLVAESKSDDIEDSWAKAFSDGDDDLDATWGAAFGDDDDELLDDGIAAQSASQNAATQSRYGPSAQAQAPVVPLAANVTAAPALSTSRPSTSSGPTEGMKFFEDLPMTAPQKVRRSARTPIPQSSATPVAPPQSAFGNRNISNSSSLSIPGSSSVPLSQSQSFVAQPSAPQASSPVRAPSQSRYSPDPTSLGTSPPVLAQPARYTPNPAAQRAISGSSTSSAPAPRPSSSYTVASASRSQSGAYEDYDILPASVPRPARRESRNSANSQAPEFSPVREVPQPGFPSQSGPPLPNGISGISPPPPVPLNPYAPRTSSPLAQPNGRALQRTAEGVKPPSRSSSYARPPSSYSQTSNPPQRPRTQSPEATRSRNSVGTVPHVATRQVSRQSFQSFSAEPSAERREVSQVHRASVSQETNFIPPVDEQASDSMQRWRGSPVFHWNGSGSITTMFPKQVPRYGGNQTMIKCMPGEVKVQKVKDLIPAHDSLATFPGPLKTKSKKKELMAWLSTRIEALQREVSSAQITTLDVRDDEKLMLWQLMRMFVEHDGVLSGNPAVDMAVRQIILPQNQTPLSAALKEESTASADATNSAVVDEISMHLAQGDREKAAWLAADNRMWGHAMLISSTLNGTLWKSMVQEYIRKEVRGTDRGNQPLAALYATFAGSFEESIDELVPASARAGFTLMSRSEDQQQHQRALDGLDKWRETLNLILSNRSNDDQKSIHALGKLLASYGRTEAAHTCFMFSRSIAIFSGADDPSASFTLVGADVVSHMFDATRDMDAILLSEVYEFGLILSGNVSQGPVPHLQAYKLHHAYTLAESGLRTDAQTYCDAIASSLKSSTKTSPYYNSALVALLDDLNKRLSQAPKDPSSSMWSKPSMGKVSGSFWNKFNNFVAGDDSDVASVGSAGAPEDNGTFSKWTGNTPTISRSGSQTNIYGMAAPPVPIPTGANSRYAPGGSASRVPSDQIKPSQGYQPADSPSSSYAPPPAFLGVPYRPSSRSSNYAPVGDSNDYFETASVRSQKSMDSYVPSAPPEEFSSPQPPVYSPSLGMPAEGIPKAYSPSPLGISAEISPPTPSERPVPEPDQVPQSGPNESLSEDQGAVVPAYSGYDPMGGGGYAPPNSYVPYEPEPDVEGEEDTPKPKKKSFMDDDEDDGFTKRSAEMKKQEEKAKRDRENEELFRKAAEEDAARAAKSAKRQSGSWLGGWFGGAAAKKEADVPVVHKAKLGEENSFFYDPELKKWVNKKAGAAQTPATATPPPPPRSMGSASGPPSRAVSASATPPPPPPATGSGGPPTFSNSRPPSSTGSLPPAPRSVSGEAPPRAGTPAGAGGPPPSSSGPPKPAASMSNASSIDDLLGAPAARKAGARKPKKKAAAYVDVMAK